MTLAACHCAHRAPMPGWLGTNIGRHMSLGNDRPGKLLCYLTQVIPARIRRRPDTLQPPNATVLRIESKVGDGGGANHSWLD